MFCMQMKAKGDGAEKGKKEEERGVGTDLQWLLWRLTVVLADGGGSKRRCCRWRWAVSPPVFPCFLSVFSFLFFSCSFFLSSSSGLFFSGAFHPPPLFVLSPSVFIGKTEGREAGATTVQPPQKNCQRGTYPLFFHRPVVGHGSEFMQVAMVGVFLMFSREKERRNVGENTGTKLSSSHVFCASKGRRKATVSFKTTPFRLFF